jgi:hypothetical protein
MQQKFMLFLEYLDSYIFAVFSDAENTECVSFAPATFLIVIDIKNFIYFVLAASHIIF